MSYLYVLAAIGLGISAIADRQKTVKSLKAAWKLFIKMVPLLLVTLSLVSIVLFFLPSDVIAKYLGTGSIFIGSIAAAVIGAVSLLPGFITFPLSGLLLDQGVSYTVIAAFTTSLMMVGIVTYPIEKKFFGAKLTIIRNISAFAIAIVVSVVIGILYGEIL